MDFITYNGKEYPTRTFKVLFEGEEHTYTIGTESLNEVIRDKYEEDGSEEQAIDNEIYFYVEDEVIELDGGELCLNYLDEPMSFLEEL